MYIIILVFVVGLLFHVYASYRMRNLPPPADGAWPIIGHTLTVLTAKNYYTLYRKIMDYILERKVESISVKIGIWNINGVLNPDDAYLVANSCLKKDIIYDYFKPFFGEGLITADVPTWKIHRKLLNPAFNQQVLDGYLNEINNQTRQLMDTVAVEVGKGPFDHHKYLSQLILQIVCATSMGISIDEEDRHTRSMFIEAIGGFFNIMAERTLKFWLNSNLIFKLTGCKKRQDMLADKMNLLSQAILNKKRNEFQLKKKIIGESVDNMPEKRFKPFIELLLESSEHGELSDREISDELNTFIGAGTDTISVTVSYALTCIGTYGAVQDTIMKELQEVFEGSDRDVEKQDLPKLKYLEAVVKETLRLYPTVPVIGRKLDKDIEIKGYTLPAGSTCYIAIYGTLRHWAWGPDAHIFRPERWLDGSLPPNMKGFAAFGLGKRSCIGANFAIMCIKTVLADFLRRYSISSDVTQMVLEFFITTKPISGHEISIKERHNK